MKMTMKVLCTFLVLLCLSLHATLAWRSLRPLSLTSHHTRTTRISIALHMSDVNPVPESASAVPEWMGAKKLSQKDSGLSAIMTSEQISKILPHRYPFLLVDRVVEFEAGKRAVGLKCVTANEPQFTGHFPDRPVMPGVLMLEAMAQLGGLIALSPPISPPSDPNDPNKKLFFFTGVTGVRWKSPVTPGDTLVMEMSLKSFDERLGFATMTGKAYVGGKVAVTVEEFSFALVR